MNAFIFNGRAKDERTMHERIAMRNIRYAINWIVGGYYNCIQDDCPEYIPETRAQVENEIYLSAIQNLYDEGYEGYNKAPKEMRFAGEAFCRAYITWKLDNDDDFAEISAFMKWR